MTIENAELQRVTAELEAERRKQLKWTWLAYGFLTGIVFYTLSAGLIWASVFKPRLEKVTASTIGMMADRDSLRAQLDDAQHALQTCKTSRNAVGVDLRSYTLLYDSAVSPAQSGPLQLLDLIRPGVGTTLAKFQPKSQTPAWFIVGKATPVFYGNVNTALVMRLDATGKPISQGAPLSAAQIQANPTLLSVGQ